MRRRIISCVIIFVLALNVFGADVFAETSNVYHKIESKQNDKRIALTFDDGPHPRMTREILSILEEYDVPATFFVIGQNAVNYPDTMKLLVESGCEIGNHTYSHESFKNMSPYEMREQFRKCTEILREDFSVEPTLIRPPQGVCAEGVYRTAQEMDYDIILWSIDTRDWAHTSATDIAQNILRNARGGDIILMHDYIAGQSGTCEALRIIIPELLSRGYELVTVSELIKSQN